MKAADVMVSSVISVRSDSTVQEVADVLLRNRISGVPVVGPDGALVGIVSEGDLIRRPEAGTLRRPSWWLALLGSKEELASEYVKSHSRKVADVKPHAIGCPFTLIAIPGFEALANYKAPYVHGETKEVAVEAVKANPQKYSHIFQVDPPESYYGKMFLLFSF